MMVPFLGRAWLGIRVGALGCRRSAQPAPAALCVRDILVSAIEANKAA